jgi:hypothetical protein
MRIPKLVGNDVSPDPASRSKLPQTAAVEGDQTEPVTEKAGEDAGEDAGEKAREKGSENDAEEAGEKDVGKEKDADAELSMEDRAKAKGKGKAKATDEEDAQKGEEGNEDGDHSDEELKKEHHSARTEEENSLLAKAALMSVSVWFYKFPTTFIKVSLSTKLTFPFRRSRRGLPTMLTGSSTLELRVETCLPLLCMTRLYPMPLVTLSIINFMRVIRNSRAKSTRRTEMNMGNSTPTIQCF